MAGHAARAPVPILAALAALAAVWLIRARRDGWAFVATGVAMLATAATIFVFLYPHVMVSSTSAANSLTRQQRLVVVVHPEGHDGGHGDLLSHRADLPGLDLLRVSPAHRRRRPAARRFGRRRARGHRGRLRGSARGSLTCRENARSAAAPQGPRGTLGAGGRRRPRAACRPWRCSPRRRCSPTPCRRPSPAAPWRRWRRRSALLAALAVARGLLAGAFESTGRRAAAGVMSQLRLELVRRRAARRPDGGRRRRVRRGRDRRRPGRRRPRDLLRPLPPQLVLAVLVPLAVLAWTVAVDPTSALIMAVTLPLIPLFMWLIGRYTEGRTRARWRALARLSNHFLDVMRGLTTLRAFNRGEVQAERIAAVGEEYRRTTMQTLRVAFVSGAVLDLAATLATALVAVTLGLRLVDGAVTLRRSAHRAAADARAVRALRALATQFHASADGLAAAERILDLIDVPLSSPAGAAPPPETGAASAWTASPSPTRAARAGARRRRPRAPPRRGRRPGRPQRLRQDDPRLTAAGAAPPRRRQRHRRRRRPRRARPRGLAPPGVVGAAAPDAVPRHRGLQHRPRRRAASTGPQLERRRRRPAPTSSCASCRTATTRRSARAAAACRPARRAVSPWRGRSCASAPLLILDEPTADLDAESAAWWPRPSARRARAGRCSSSSTARPSRASPTASCAWPTARRWSNRSRRARGNAALLELLRIAGCPACGSRRRSPSGRSAPSLLGVGLMAFAGYLISRSAERPPVLSLTVVIVAVRFFGLARPLARYLERLTSHDLAFRLLARMRVAFFTRLEPLVPAPRRGLPQGRPAGPHGRRRRRPAEPVPARAHAAARRVARRRGLGRGLRRPSCPPRGSSWRPVCWPAGSSCRSSRRPPDAGPAPGRPGLAPSSRWSWSSFCAARPSWSCSAPTGPRWRASRRSTPSSLTWPAARLWRRDWSRDSASRSSA